MNAPSLTPASPVSSDGSLFTPPIQELPPVHSNNHKSFKEEQEVQAKRVIFPSMTLRNYVDWHILTDLINSSLDLTKIYWTGDYRDIRLSHKLTHVQISLQSQNMGYILLIGDFYQALYPAFKTHVSREYLLTLSEDKRGSIYYVHTARCLELPEALQDDELTRGPRTIDLLLGERTFIGDRRAHV